MRNEALIQALSYLNLIIAAGVTVLIMLLLLQKQRRPLKFFIAAFYLLVAYGLVICWLARSEFITATPFLLYTNYIVSFALGPIIYLYTRQLLNRTARLRSGLLPMFLPTLFMLCVVAAYHIGFPASVSTALRHHSPFPRLDEPVMYALSAIADFSVIVYFFLATLRIRAAARHSGPAQAGSLRLFSSLYLAPVVTYLAVLVGHLTDNLPLTMIASTANGFSILAYFLYIHQSPEITQWSLKKPKAMLRSDYQETEFRPKEVMARLEILMTKERIYREPELTLRSLSGILEISTNDLSLVLNDMMGVSFRTCVNARRLEEAKQLLIGDGHFSILDIAFRVGFNSKTTFNTLFLRETGMTPKAYRKKLSNSIG
ncbi:MAG: helix-turn-helix transcriptional regulator [Spirochaetia bacterium]